MKEKDTNVLAQMVQAADLLPEPQRQRILGIAEGVAIAVSVKDKDFKETKNHDEAKESEK